jgi:CheY-like chemotaxis protein
MDPQPTCYPNQPSVILIVEDDLDNLILMNQQVSLLLNCSIVTASTGKTAIALAKSTLPDLILLDMMLPDIDGFEVVRQLKQDAETAPIPVIAVSAMVRNKDYEQALLAGCCNYLRKPYELESLELLIYRCILPPLENVASIAGPVHAS